MMIELFLKDAEQYMYFGRALSKGTAECIKFKFEVQENYQSWNERLLRKQVLKGAWAKDCKRLLWVRSWRRKGWSEAWTLHDQLCLVLKVQIRHRKNLQLLNRNSAGALNENCFFFLFFENFLRKLLNLSFSKQNMLSDQKLSNHELLSIFLSPFFMIFRVYVKIFSHTFFHFMKDKTFFDHFVKIRA